MAFFTNVRTGARARASILTLVYNKVSKLRNVGDKSIGEVNNSAVSDSAIEWNSCFVYAGISLIYRSHKSIALLSLLLV